MTDWTDGYNANIDYTHGYYHELNPVRSQLAFIYAGLVPPAMGTHCELGFGQGLSINLHAAAAGSTWYGCDFNPAQAGFAQSMAQASGATAHLSDEAFAEFCARADLPTFDSIGLHGIWSWISNDNRAVLVDFVRRKLKVGGSVYISYNTQPGWAAMAPMRELLAEHAQRISTPGNGILSQVDAALDFASQLFATQPRYLKNNPHMADRLKKIKEHNRNYLAHEYFNRDWLPMPFSSMVQWLTPAKMSLACSAAYADHIPPLNFTSEQAAMLNGITDTNFRETVRDFMVDQQFRKDYWVKGARKLNLLERAQALRAQRVVLVQPRSGVSLKINGSLGEANLQENIYNPLLDFLADYRPHSIAEIERAMATPAKGKGKPRATNFNQLTEAIMILVSTGNVSPAQDDETSLRMKPTTDRLNTHLLDHARSNDTVHYLASPVTGGGISVPRFNQLFLWAASQGLQKPTEWAQSAWQALQAQGQKLLHEGKMLDTEEANLAQLTVQAKAFATVKLPVLRALQVVPGTIA